MSLIYYPCICFSFHLFSISRFSLFWFSFGFFASSTFTVPFSPTTPSNTSSEFLPYQLKLFSSPQTQASQLMSPLPESSPLLPGYKYSCSITSAVQLLIRDFKIQRRGRQRKRKKTIDSISKTSTLHEHHAFLYISLPVFARLRRENACTNFAFYGGRKQAKTKFYFSFCTWIWSQIIQFPEGSPTFDKVSG